MAITHVQSTGNTVGAGTASATTIAQAYTSNVAVGNLLVMCVSWGSSSPAPSSVVDTRGNTWVAATGVIADATNTEWWALYYVASCAGSGANTVTVTWAATQNVRAIAVSEFTGQATSSVVDGTPIGQKYTAAGVVADTVTSGNITTTVNGDMIYGACLVHNALSCTVGTGFTEVWHEPGDWMSVEYRTQTTAGSIAAVWSPNSAGDFLTGAIAFKAAATGPTTVTGTDSGTLSDSSAVTQGRAVTDTGALSDTSAVVQSTGASGTDTGTGTEGATGLVAASARVDTGTLAESVAIVVTYSRTDTGTLTESASAQVPSSAVFIAGVSANNRYLIDQNGAPILVLHDVAWALAGALSTTEMGTYFADRAARGFNAIEVVAIPFWFPSGVYTNGTFDGVAAFNSNDVTQPNSTYWARFDTMVASAAANGLTLFIGCAGAPQQFDSSAAEGAWSTAEATSFGTFLGNRYKTASNIVWLFGVDYASTDWSTYNVYMQNISNAITAAGDTHLQTIQLHRDNYSDQNTGLAGRWDFQTAYTYQAAYKAVRPAYAANVGPVVLIESNYEDENNEGGPSTNAAAVRRNVAWAYTNGGVGAGYGHHDIWQMTTSVWPSELASTWIQPLARIRARLASLTGWQLLVPDTTGTFLTSGAGTDVTSGSQNGSLVDPLETDYATAAFHTGLGVVYVPTTRTVTIDKTEISGLTASYWVDASNASLTPTTATFTGNNVTSPGTNAAGDQDWFLILEGTPNLLVTDTGSLTESRVTLAALGRTDTGTGTEGATGVAAASAVTDTGTLAEAVSIVVTSTSTDTGTGSDTSAVSVVFLAVSTTDTGALTDTSSVNAGATPVTGTDSGALSESVSIVVTLSGVDSGAGTDSSTVSQGGNPAVTDTGSLTESVTVSVVLTASDQGGGVDSSGPVVGGLSRADTGTGADSSSVNQSAGPQVSDVGTLTEGAAVAVVVSRTDQGTLTDSGVRVDLTNPAAARETTARIRGHRFTGRIRG